MKNIIDTIDFRLLREQKESLIEVLFNLQKDRDTKGEAIKNLTGLLHLIDALEDKELENRNFKTFVVIHEHRHGATTYQISCNKDITTMINEENPPSDEEQIIIDSLEIDMELSRDESITIEEIQTERQFIF